MKKFPIFLLVMILGGLLSSSCITRKKLVYLQDKEDGLIIDEEGYIKIIRESYKLQQGDMLMVTIKSLDESANKLFEISDLAGLGGGGVGGGRGGMIFYLRGNSIDSEGLIRLPVLGAIPAAGLTLEELQKELDRKLALYFKESTVYSKVVQAGIRYTVIGEVNTPGKHEIYQPYVNIFEALANAGDIAYLGDRRRVQIIRQYPEGVKIYELDLTDRRVLNDPLYFVQPNDIIQVKPLPQKTFGFGTTGLQTFSTAMTLLTSTLLIISLFNIN